MRRQPNWGILIFGAALVAVGFVAGTAMHDISPTSNSAVHAALPEANRIAKRDRLRVRIPDNHANVTGDRGAKHEDGAPRDTKAKPVMHCEPVGSPLAGTAIGKLPPRSCLARLETFPQYTILWLVALRDA